MMTKNITLSSITTRLLRLISPLAIVSNISRRSYTNDTKGQIQTVEKVNLPSATTSRTSSYVTSFNKAKQLKNIPERERFATVMKEFMQKEKFRRGHVTFIDSALIKIPEFNLEKDLLTYNRLFDLIPKNKYRSKTLFDALWPKPIPQIDLALRVLEKMEDNGVRPDDVTYSLLCEIFGRTSFPVQKCVRMAILFDKYENIDPYRLKEGMPSEQWEIAKLALQRMTGEDCLFHEIMVPETAENSFIIGANNGSQRDKLNSLTQNDDSSNLLLHVEGPHRLWLQKVPVFYYSLRASSRLEQKSDGVFLGICMCRPPTQDSLVTWIEYLQDNHPVLKNITVVYDVTVVKDIRDWSDQTRLPFVSATRIEQ